MQLLTNGAAVRRRQDADDAAVLRLARSRRVGPATFHRLVAAEGSIAAALDALPRIARDAGVTDYAICPEGVAAAELAAGRRAGAILVRFDDPSYPAALHDLEDAPPVLWVMGDIGCLARPCIAVIGARNASSLGLRMAQGLAGGLATAGVTVVAGLARGIDTAAHEASVPGGTAAVLAGGLDRLYPAENAALSQAIVEAGGALVSEQAFGTEPAARLFPLRNRIVSGLSRAVVVVEAAHRSGTLITARCALDQGREVMAVPGHPMDARASGCNALIRDGALLVRSAADVLAALAIEAVDAGGVPAPHHPADKRSGAQRIIETLRRPGAVGAVSRSSRNQASPARSGPAPAGARQDAGGPVAVEARLLSLLGRSPTEETTLLRDLGLTAAALAPALLSLELEGKVVRTPGGMIALT